MNTPWTKYTIAALTAALCNTAMGQLSTLDSYDRCVRDSSAFSTDEKLNEVVAEYLANIQKELDSSVYVSRVAGMAGLGDRSKQARLKADQYQQELHRACAQLSQPMNETGQRPQPDQIAPAQAPQTAEHQRQAIVERELNRRIPGAIFMMNEAGFSQWLDGKQGKALRRDVWEQAIAAENFEQAAQMLRNYERAQISK